MGMSGVLMGLRHKAIGCRLIMGMKVFFIGV